MNRFVLSLALFATIFFTSSCDDSEEIIGEETITDKKAPDVNLLNPTSGSRVKGTLTITATAEDESEKVFMQLFVDDTLLTSDSTKQIEADLNTKTISEGIHKIIVKAKDESGNESNKEFSFEVRNILMTIDVPHSYIPSFTRIFYVLSKNDGEIMAYGEMENESVISVPTPEDFNPDSSFVYGEYFFLDDGFTLVKSGSAYAAMEAGCYKLYKTRRSVPVSGKHGFRIDNVPSNTEVRTQGRSVGTTFLFALPLADFIESEFFMYGATSDLFISAVDTGFPAQYPPRYYYKENIEVDASTNISLNDFTVMDKYSIPLRESVLEYATNVEGYFQESDLAYDVSNFYGLEETASAEVYATANLFDKFKTRISLISADVSYTNDIISSSIPANFEYLDVKLKDINRSDNHIQVNTSGEFDILTVHASYSNYTGDRMILKNFSSNFPGGVNEITIPKSLPQELIDLGFEEVTTFGFTKAAFVNYTELEGRADYRNDIVFSSDRKARSSRASIGKVETLAPDATGRMNIQSNKKFKKVEPIIERLNLQHLIN